MTKSQNETQPQERTERPTRTSLTTPKKTIADKIGGQDFKLALAAVLPKHLTPDRIVRVAIQAMTRIPDLAKCDFQTFCTQLMKLSALGLEPDGYQAHLIPFWSSKRKCFECVLIVDYKGLVEVAMRTGMFSQPPIAQIVRWNDVFVFDKGVVVKHTVDWRSERGPAYAAYVIVKTKAGGEIGHVMGKEAIEAIRERSKSPDSGPWVTDWEEMAKKTVFRQMSKWLPRSPEFRDAVEADPDSVESMRVDAARPIFDATPAKALFGGSDAENGLGDDGDLGPQTQSESSPAPQVPHQGSEASSPPPGSAAVEQHKEKAPEAQDAKQRRLLKAVNFLLKATTHSEADLLKFLRDSNRIDDSLGTLAQVADCKLTALEWVHENWKSCSDELERRKEARP